MKRLLLLFGFLFLFSFSSFSQEYTIDGKSYNLQTEVEGTITLLWNVIDGEYRYFIKKGNELTELKNSRVDGDYQEEFKDVLRLYTNEAPGEIEDTKLTLSSLKAYFDTYNKAMDPSYQVEGPNIDLQLRLAPFVGVSNAIFTENPRNALLLVLGADLELVDELKLRRHAVVLRFKQTIENSDFEYNETQFSLNYRFKFVKSDKVDVFVNGKFAAYTYSTRDDEVNPLFGMPGEPEFLSKSGGDLSAPATFGLGADIVIGSGRLFITYNDIVGIGVDSNGEFPTDFSVGYKFNL